MKLFLFLLVTAMATIGMSSRAKAQNASKIMDTGIDWTSSGGGGVDGQLNVYLTDTSGIAGLTVAYGLTDTTSNYFSGQYTVSPGGTFWTNGTAQGTALSLPIGHFSESVTGYLRVMVLLTGGGTYLMDVVK